jgi:hypothetical protein
MAGETKHCCDQSKFHLFFPFIRRRLNTSKHVPMETHMSFWLYKQTDAVVVRERSARGNRGNIVLTKVYLLRKNWRPLSRKLYSPSATPTAQEGSSLRREH